MCRSGINQLTLGNYNHRGPLSWSPDGSMVAFQAWDRGDWKIFYVLSTGGPAERLTNSSQWMIEPGPSWSSRLR